MCLYVITSKFNAFKTYKFIKTGHSFNLAVKTKDLNRKPILDFKNMILFVTNV